MKELSKFLMSIYFVIGYSGSISAKDMQVTPIEKVNWEKLNPARGDKSPQAATLWGDRKGNSATGFLAKFVDGFSSPPHIHNVSYRAIVIEGLIHNDDPKAASMWMPSGSYWTQPAGEPHITAAKGKNNIVLVEIDHGPYLVKPVKNSFDNGERPFNIHRSNIIWRKKVDHSVVDLWAGGDGTVMGSILKFRKSLSLNKDMLKIVVIHGVLEMNEQNLRPGSFIERHGKAKTELRCVSEECLVYMKDS